MNTKITIAQRFVQDSRTEGPDYVRPAAADLRAAGGVCVESANDNARGGSWSHSPTEWWEFPDGSRLEVAFSDCNVCSWGNPAQE